MHWYFSALPAIWLTRKIFPALQAKIERGKLQISVIGVANAGWNKEGDES